MPARSPQTNQHQATNGVMNGNSPYSGADEVVISGISGRFPESNSIAEFRENLFAGVDLVTDDDRRWPDGEYLYIFCNLKYIKYNVEYLSIILFAKHFFFRPRTKGTIFRLHISFSFHKIINFGFVFVFVNENVPMKKSVSAGLNTCRS